MLYYTSAAEIAAAILLFLGIYTRYVSLLMIPLIAAIAYHWAIRKGFWFADAGAEMPLTWTLMLVVQVLLGDGAYAVQVPALPWEQRGIQRTAA